MNLVVVSGIFPPEAGGPATYVARLGSELAKRGHRVTVVTLGEPGPGRPAAHPFSVVRIPRRLFRPLRVALTICTLVRLGRGADLLFVNGLYPEAAVANLLLRRPVVHKIVGDWVWERARNKGWTEESFEEFQRGQHRFRLEALKALRNRCLRLADLVIVPSRFLAGWAESWGVRPANIRVIYNAVESPEPPACGPAISLRTRYKLISVGRLVRWKELDQLIDVLGSFQDVGLVLVGDGPEEGSLRARAARLGLQERVCFLGRLDREAVFVALGACDLFVLNSSYEGLPHALLEAMQAGLPVVATDAGGTREVVEDGKTGLLVPSRDALAQAIGELLADPERRAAMARAAREVVCSRFSLAQMVETTEAALREAASAGTARWGPGAIVGRAWTRLTSGFGGEVGLLTVANGISAALSVVQGVLVARLLGPDLYGVAALVMSYPGVLFSVADARSMEAAVKYLGEFTAKRENARALAFCKLGYAIDIAVGVVSLVLVAVTASWAEARVVQTPRTAWLIVIYALGFAVRSLVGTAYAVLITCKRVRTVASIEILSGLLRAALVVGAVLAGLGVPGVIWGNAIGLASYGVAMLVEARPAGRRAWGGSWWAASLGELRGLQREIARVLLYGEVHALLLSVPRYLDVTLLGFLRGPREAGYYRLGRSLQGLMWLVGNPLQSVTLRRLSQLRSTATPGEVLSFVRRVFLLVGLPLGVVGAAATLAAPAGIRLLVGRAFAGAEPAVQIMLGGTVVWLVFFWVRPGAMASGRVDLYTWWFAASLWPYAVSFAYLVSQFGAAGLAVGYLAHTLLLLPPLAWRILQRP